MNFINIEQPLVSIIMACYNSIKTIDESISSVINQDYKNFELIIADDNSTDGTYEFIISKYSSSDKVKIIRNEGNDSNLLIVFYVQIMPDDLVMQLHR
ncbi:glycosyltransferase family 2 protein, partial [Escherichia coli]|uniref:glycosyltransferase family 2 protein n=1 Tax=Escherichia coli TaxID=562 RepID=UPI001EDC6558